MVSRRSLSKKGRKAREQEYIFRVFRLFDNRKQKPEIIFCIETVKQFVNFRYKILFSFSKIKHILRFEIKGLDAPSTLMPGTGSAIGSLTENDLSGKYHIQIVDLDGTTNEFLADFKKNVIQLRMLSKEPFIIGSTEPIEINNE